MMKSLLRFTDGDEEWRSLADFEAGFSRYLVSNIGRVRRSRDGSQRILKADADEPGYYRVSLAGDDGRRYWRRIHLLVLHAFIGPRPPGLVACHNDGDKLNNDAGNLRWDTHQANMEDAKRHGDIGPILSGPEIDEIRRLKAEGCRAPALAEKFGVSWRTIYRYVKVDKPVKSVVTKKTSGRMTRRTRNKLPWSSIDALRFD